MSDGLAEYFSMGLGKVPHMTLALRDKHIIPCHNCGCCIPPPHSCSLDEKDDCAEIFTALLQARLVVFASPIYFYALPAHFKAFIDRCQRFWVDKSTIRPQFSALSLLASGRAHGEKLFEGAQRTLVWFLKPLNGVARASLCFRGLENLSDLKGRPEIAAEIGALARFWAREIG